MSGVIITLALVALVVAIAVLVLIHRRNERRRAASPRRLTKGYQLSKRQRGAELTSDHVWVPPANRPPVSSSRNSGLSRESDNAATIAGYDQSHLYPYSDSDDRSDRRGNRYDDSSNSGDSHGSHYSGSGHSNDSSPYGSGSSHSSGSYGGSDSSSSSSSSSSDSGGGGGGSCD